MIFPRIGMLALFGMNDVLKWLYEGFPTRAFRLVFVIRPKPFAAAGFLFTSQIGPAWILSDMNDILKWLHKGFVLLMLWGSCHTILIKAPEQQLWLFSCRPALAAKVGVLLSATQPNAAIHDSGAYQEHDISRVNLLSCF
jgi:hypothetical protein